MKKAFLLTIFLLAGCSTTARLYPVSGPKFEKNIVVPIHATVSGIMGNNGGFKIHQHDGSVCLGEWSSAAGQVTTFSEGSLMGRYGPANFSGYSVSSGGGQNPGQAIATCADGNVYNIEFTTGGGTANGFGIAKDRFGNVFKILF